MALMKMPCAVGTGGGSQFQAELLTTVPSKITTPFKPKKICVGAIFGSSIMCYWYDEDISTTESYRYYNGGKQTYNIPWQNPDAACISKVEDDGFTLAVNSSMTQIYYVAVG